MQSSCRARWCCHMDSCWMVAAARFAHSAHVISHIHTGILPFARELLRCGTHVTLAANEAASINDVTAGELRSIVAAAAGGHGELGRAVSELALQVASTGTDMCVIDLRRVSVRFSASLQLEEPL